MEPPAIRRYISDDKAFGVIKSDFRFLVGKIKKSGFEYDLQIRDGYFNLYYKGNSIGKILYKRRSKHYQITIHHRFIDKRIRDRFSPKRKNQYEIFSIPGNKLHPLFSDQNLKSMASKVKRINFQEEIIYEQMLMTDNVNRYDLIIIDRQVMDKFSKTKMDLLALKNKQGTDYQFCVIEVKLGNNPELKDKVISQLNGYVRRIERNFRHYKLCYERNFAQKRELGLLERPDTISIVPGVLAVVVVMGYSGVAKQKIEELKERDSSIMVIPLFNELDFRHLN